jgi:hypothetical protein
LDPFHTAPTAAPRSVWLHIALSLSPCFKQICLKRGESEKLLTHALLQVIEWFRQSNSRVIEALRDHLLPKKEKGGPKSAHLRQLFMTSQMTCIINGENEKIDHETDGYCR